MPSDKEKPSDNGSNEVGIKIGSRKQVFWREVHENTKAELERLEKLILFNNAILELSEVKEKEEENASNN